MYTIKQLPQDFIVKEISKLDVKPGRFLYYKLTKKKRNTLDVVKEIARHLHIKEKQIGFAGSKDKQAVTSQTISIEGKRKQNIESLQLRNSELLFLGSGSEPICLGDLVGNSFEIVVRKITVAPQKIDFIPNYFDEQRFSKNNAKIGRYIIKKQFKDALNLIDFPSLKERLDKNSNDFVGALRKIPMRLLKMYVHAYQSYLWNETLARTLNGTKVQYSLGEFVFPETNEPGLQVPLIGFSAISEGKFSQLISQIMQEENITHQDFIIKQIPQLSLEGEMRTAFVEVKDLGISEIEADELKPGTQKVTISFTLPKGSYATMVVRRIFLNIDNVS